MINANRSLTYRAAAVNGKRTSPYVEINRNRNGPARRKRHGAAAAKSAPIVTSAAIFGAQIYISWLLPTDVDAYLSRARDGANRTEITRTVISISVELVHLTRRAKSRRIPMDLSSAPPSHFQILENVRGTRIEHSRDRIFGNIFETKLSRISEMNEIAIYPIKKKSSVRWWSLRDESWKESFARNEKSEDNLSSLYRDDGRASFLFLFHASFPVPKVITSTSLPYVPQICANIHRGARLPLTT